jgi:glycosyltransferase involved in cell wall biosynthesis
MKLSVIVCTRNRARSIVGCLDSIVAALAKASPIDAEIVVVDNGSEDNTSSIVREFASSSTFPIHLQLERQLGISRARNCALRAARGELLVWTDDDCRLSENYITNALRHDAADTDLVLRGGRIELGDPLDLPITINTSRTAKRWQRSMDSARDGNLGSELAGCNLMMRRALVERLGLFDERFGVGADVPASEDTEYVFRAYLAGIAIEYVPDMVVFHYHGRREKPAAARLMRDYLIGTGALYAKYALKDPNLCRPFLQDFKKFLKEIASGKSGFMPEIGFSYRKLIACNMLGAAQYLLARSKSRSRTAPVKYGTAFHP